MPEATFPDIVGELAPVFIVQVPGTVHSKLAPGIFVIEYV